MTNSVIGIDADVHRIAYAVIDHDYIQDVRTVKRSNSRSRIDEAYTQQLTEMIRHAQNIGAVIWLEDIYLASSQQAQRNVQTFKQLSEVQGEIKHVARQHNVPVETVSANEWHGDVLGFTEGREALKKASRDFVSKHADERVLTEHEADALCVALWAHGVRREAV